MKRIRVANLAERDLDKIWHRIATKSGSIEIANSVIESITESFGLFSSTPGAGTIRDEIDPGVRGFPVGSYFIYYREDDRYVIISRVISGMRDQVTADQNDPED